MKPRFNNTVFAYCIKSLALFVLLLLNTNSTYAQISDKNSKTEQITQVIDTSLKSVFAINPEYSGSEQRVFPPSPTAASLGRYGEIPVTMYSGIPNINIPLFELESTKLSLPVSMSYQATGVKVEEIPGWVGLGWVLNAGGVITRSVNNLIDEQPNSGYIDFSQNIPSSYSTASCEFLESMADPHNLTGDAEPDIFYFNFLGEGGKFVFGTDGNPKLLPYKKLDIQKQIGIVSGRYGIISFIIKTLDGTKYEFGGQDAIEISKAQTRGPSRPSFVSSWYLTRIVSSDLNDTIRFAYTSNSYVSDPQTNHTMRHSSNCGSYWQGGALSTSTTTMSISTKSLSTIESKKGKLVFSHADRNDINGGHKLTSISLYSKGGQQPFKSYSFSYSDVSSSPSATGYGGKRMFLDYITAKDSLGENVNKYAFSYYDRNSLPPRHSFAKDHWGFYNGASNDILIPASPSYGLPGANREPNENYIKNGILDKITYPTGGYTQFVYEAHKNSTTLLGGGVRIREVHNFDGTITIKKKYTYGNGTRFFKPVYEYIMDVGVGNFTYCGELFRQSYSHTLLGTSNGGYVGYPNVTEWIGLNGEGGKTEWTYTHFNDQGSISYPFAPASPFDWARGHLIKEKHYVYDSGSFTLKEETAYDYGNITGNVENSYDVKGVRVGYERIIHPNDLGQCMASFSFNRYQEYYYNSRWFYLEKKTKKTYLPEGTVTENTRYYHSNPNHAQLTKQTETTSKGDSIQTFYYYPDDYPSFFQSLKDNFIVGKPIDVRVYNNDRLIDGQQFAYNNFGLPATVYKAKVSPEGSVPFNVGNPYTFESLMDISYNTDYNIQQITPSNDHSTVYLWSYNGTYPVMKIENATYSQVLNLAGSSVSELRNATSPTVIDSKLQQISNILSSNPTSVLITTYKYRRHVGISEISGPSGLKTKYAYDRFGRLNSIRDDEDKLLQQFIYNYLNK